jgi:uncharacterized protein (DUF736 family)
MEIKNNSGAIFKNDKRTAETHPHYKGKVMVNNEEMEIALWLKESKSGTKYFSAQFTPPYKRAELAPTPIAPAEDDDVPF